MVNSKQQMTFTNDDRFGLVDIGRKKVDGTARVGKDAVILAIHGTPVSGLSTVVT
jgi:hypothetical protein